VKSLLDQIMEEWEKKGLDPASLLNKMIEQWKEKGIDPNFMLDQLKSMPANIKGKPSFDTFEKLMGEFKDDDLESFDLLNPFIPWEEDKLEFNKDSKASIELIKAISCGALLSVINGSYLNSIHTGLSQSKAQGLLKEWWNVTSRNSLRDCITYIESREHANLWNTIWTSLQTVPVELWEENEEDVLGVIEVEVDNPEQAEIFLYNVVDVYAFLKDYLQIDSKGTYSIESWDLCRGINIFRWAFDAGYCSEEEAEKGILKFANQLYPKYKSWEKLSLGYILGASMWSGNIDMVNDLLHAHHILLSDSKSPWQLLDW